MTTYRAMPLMGTHYVREAVNAVLPGGNQFVAIHDGSTVLAYVAAEHVDKIVAALEATDREFEAQYGPHAFERSDDITRPDACDYCGQDRSHEVHAGDWAGA